MSMSVQNSDSVFQWNSAISHHGHCIVQKGKGYRLFSPDGFLLDEEFSSLTEAKQQASYYFLQSAIQELLDDWHESKVVTPDQYNRILDAMRVDKTGSLWTRASQMQEVA